MTNLRIATASTGKNNRNIIHINEKSPAIITITGDFIYFVTV